MLLLDTAGRLHVDQALMDEMKAVADVSKPQEILLVVDALTGQDAVNVAKNFSEQVDLTGVLGHAQVTDAYLAALARTRGGRVATLDRAFAAVAPDVVDLIAP